MASMPHDKVLQLVSLKGPVVPSDISKDIGTNTLLASAILSELVSSNKLKVSNIKLGTSPLYYLSGQESQLERFAERLNEKEKRVFDSLRTKKVIRDTGQDTLTRYALRQIKDFAKPIEVTLNDKKELFWRWHTSTKEEIEPIIKQELLAELQKPVVRLPERPAPVPEPVQSPVLKRPVEAQSAAEVIVRQRPVATVQSQVAAPVLVTPSPRKETITDFETASTAAVAPPVTVPIRPRQVEVARKILQEPKPVAPPKPVVSRPKSEKKAFLDTLTDFFRKNSIKIVEQQIIKKDSEMDFVIKIQSSVGELLYYCKARDKKRCSETDLNSAFVSGQLKKLPVLFLTTGQLTKGASEMILNEFRGITVKYL